MLLTHGPRLVGVVAASVLLLAVSAYGADWPTCQRDNARSAVTSERLALPLSPQWVFKSPWPPARGWDEPEHGEVWSYGVTRVGRVRYDDSFPVAAVGDAVYFASSAENKVYAIDASGAAVRWIFYTDAPPRLAPTVWDDKVYFGCDDGFVYCLRAADAALVWKFRAAPGEACVLGQGKIISLWPVRTGVLVDGGIAYFAAGLFPAEGLYLYAVRADDGTLVWRNDSFDQGGRGNISPQGYLLASRTKLFVPSGRISPAAFSRQDGRLLFEVESGWGLIGGSYAMLSDDFLYSGTQLVMGYGPEDGKRVFSWFRGRRVVVDKGIAYLVTDSEMLAIPQDAMPEASREVDKLRESFWNNRNEIRAYQRAQQELAGGEENGSRRDRVVKELERLRPKYDAYLEVERMVSRYLDRACKWRLKCEVPDALILAGDVLFAGGEGRVVAVDAVTGKQVWTAGVSGNARGLAVADGRLLVSTTTGNVYCFAAGSNLAAGAAKIIAPAAKAPPYPADGLSRFYAQTADEIVRRAGIRKGYCVVLGGGTGRLACELAKRTELTLCVVEPDDRKVAEARKALSRAGLYGPRVSVRHGSLASLPYPPYFANLIVCEEALLGGRISTPAKEVLRMLRPLGGVAYVGRPSWAKGLGTPLDPGDLRRWLSDLDESTAGIAIDGNWARITRGELPGAADWSHQYADAGNTACSGDRVARAPLGILWFGDPGPKKMIERHARAPAPLSTGGRMFILGRDLVMAYDAYNGLPLWQRELPGSRREGLPMETGSMAATRESLFVLAEEKCLRLEAATGETRQTYCVPPRQDGQQRRWGWIAVAGGQLFGSRTQSDRPYRSWPEPRYHISESVFAIDLATEKVKWVYDGEQIMNVSLAVGDGKLFLIDSAVTEQQRRQAVRRPVKEPGEEDRPLVDRKGQPVPRDVRLVAALDASTGAKRWELPLDVTDCVVGPESSPVAGGEISLIYTRGVLLLCSAPWNGHFLKEFEAGKFSRRSIIALSGDDGKRLWSARKGYRSRPLVAGSTIYAEPWAHDLRTGQSKLRSHTLSGRPEKWEIWRGYAGCGTMAAAANTLLFRCETIGYYDLAGDHGVVRFGGQRPGCWINFVPAAGLILIPEGSSECVCPFAIQCSLALYPRQANRGWGDFTVRKPLSPVKHLAVNVGAPGDRRDRQGTLWLAWPRKGMLGSDVDLWMPYWGPSEKFYHHRLDAMKIDGTGRSWIYTSGSRGLEKLGFRLIDEGQPPAKYTVRLGFAEPEPLQAGQRVFHVWLQGKQVLKDFDVVREAGGPRRAIIKQFRDVEVSDVLRLELTPSGDAITRPPILCGLEAIEQP